MLDFVSAVSAHLAPVECKQHEATQSSQYSITRRKMKYRRGYERGHYFLGRDYSISYGRERERRGEKRETSGAGALGLSSQLRASVLMEFGDILLISSWVCHLR